MDWRSRRFGGSLRKFQRWPMDSRQRLIRQVASRSGPAARLRWAGQLHRVDQAPQVALACLVHLVLPQAGGIGTPANALNGPSRPGQPGALGQLGAIGQPSAGVQPGQSGTQPAGSTSGSNPSATAGTSVGSDQSDGSSNPSAIPSGDTPTIIGGNTIGVGSKVNKSSIIIYDKAKNYRLFEFIWDPSKDNLGVGQPGVQTGTGLGQPLGQTPFGQQPGQNPDNAPQNPRQPPQNPPLQQ